jgi:pilus assembly protein CpaF
MAALALARRDAPKPLPQGLSPQYQELKFVLHRKLLERINLEAISTMATERARAEIRTAVVRLVEEERTPLSLFEKQRISEEVMNEVFGLGPLEPLLQDPTVSDILVTTPKLVFVERGGRLVRTPVQFRDDAHLLRIIERIVSRVGRRVDESSPMVDARLPDGSRVNAIIPPVAVDGPLLSIRRFQTDRLAASQLVANLTMTPEMLELLQTCVRSRLNIVVSGGTGAGKTTLLNVLSGSIPEDERIVTIEDAAELQLRQVHVARLETRPPNLEGEGAIKQRHLLINALRMRPDRIIIGEVRGHEAIDMLQAMNTGHDGSLGTIHANTPRDAMMRVENMVGLAGINLSPRAVRTQIASALDLIIQISRMRDGVRRVTSVTEIVGMEGDVVTLQDLYTYEFEGEDPQGRLIGRFKSTGFRPHFLTKAAYFGVDRLLLEAMA